MKAYFLKRPTATITIIFISWRIVLSLTAAIADKFLPIFGNRFPYVEILQESKLPYWIWSFGNFDGVHYLRIAEDGYAYQFTQVFFPLYPILVRFFSYATFSNLLISGLLVSNICFLAGLLIFYKLVKKNYSESIAIWTCIFLIVFPTSFYFGAVYTESIFFLLTVSAFYFGEKNKLLIASLLGAAASSTRLVGIFLSVSLIKRLKIKNLLPLAIVPLGLVLYMTYLYIEFKNPLYFLSAQTIFGQERSTTQIILLPQVFWRYIKILLSTSGLPLFSAVLELLSTIFVIVALIAASGKVKREWLIFSWLSVLTPTLTGTLTSMPRYILVAFPVFIVLASIKNIIYKYIICLIFVVLLVICTTLFTRGYWLA